MPMNADFDFLSTAAMRESLPPCCRAMRIDGLQNRRSREISTRDALPEDRLIQSAQNGRSVMISLASARGRKASSCPLYLRANFGYCPAPCPLIPLSRDGPDGRSA